MGWSRVAVVLLSAASCHAGLLGAGTGEGSCAAAPFRALAVKWPAGCPASAPCCSEYGYCQPEKTGAPECSVTVTESVMESLSPRRQSTLRTLPLLMVIQLPPICWWFLLELEHLLWHLWHLSPL